jgi:type II secretory pathway component PulM
VRELVQRLLDQWSELDARERLLASIAGASLAVIVVWFGLVSPAVARVDAALQRVDTVEQELALAVRLRQELAEVEGRLAHVEERVRTGPRGNLFTTLESLASQSAVQVASVEPQSAPTHERYREAKVQVVLKEVTLAQAVNFLHRIESTPQLLSVKSLRIRTHASKSDLLDVTFTVSSFEPL